MTQETLITIELDDGQQVAIEPEDQRRLAGLLGDGDGRSFQATLRASDDTEGHLKTGPYVRADGDEDTEGHLKTGPYVRADGDEDTEGHIRRGPYVRVVVDVADFDTEGHALTLRFPNQEAAEAFKRRAAAGVIAASLVIGGAAAGVALAPTIGGTDTVVDAPIVQAAPLARDIDHYTGDWTPAAPMAAPAVRDTDSFSGDWTPGQAAPAVRDTDSYSGDWTPGQAAPTVRDTDRYEPPVAPPASDESPQDPRDPHPF